MKSATEPVIGQADTPKRGRPTLYSLELAQKVCTMIVNGKTLNKICLRKDMPSRETMYQWLANNAVFSDMYVRACEVRREIKFESLGDMIDSEKDHQKARLKLDAFKWQLSKEDPRKYGEKIDITSGNQKIKRGMSIEEINAVLARADAEKAERAAAAEASQTNGG